MPQYPSFVQVNFLERGDEIGAQDVRTRLDHVQNREMNGNHSGVHATHVELVALIEEVLQVQYLLCLVE